MPPTHPHSRSGAARLTLLPALAFIAALLLGAELLTSPAAAAQTAPLRVPVTSMSDEAGSQTVLIADPVPLPAGATTSQLELDLPGGCRLGEGAELTCTDSSFTFTAMIATSDGFSEPAVSATDTGVEVTTAEPAGEGELLVPIFSPAGLDVDDTASKQMLAELVLGNGTAEAPDTAETAGAPPSLAPYAEAIERPEQVTVPSDYIYDPDHEQKALHDYCTWSPDAWGKADFRGPCARHDMCIEVDLGLPRPERKERRKICDSTFLDHLVQNCDYGYYDAGVKRRGCRVIAGHYYVAVAGKTAIS